MPAPQGELLTVNVGGEDIDVAIEPTLYSRRSIDALAMLYKKKVRESAMAAIADLRTADIPEEMKAEMRAEYTSILKKSMMPGIGEAMEALQTPEGMIVALETNSNLTREDATRVVNNTPNIISIFTKLSLVVANEAEAEKN